jgi:hypothetical protein
VEFTVRLLCREKKIRERLPVDSANFFTRPIMAQCRLGCRNACIVLQQGCSSKTIVVAYSPARRSARKLLRTDPPSG